MVSKLALEARMHFLHEYVPGSFDKIRPTIEFSKMKVQKHRLLPISNINACGYICLEVIISMDIRAKSS